jgi:hypothetical protein
MSMKRTSLNIEEALIKQIAAEANRQNLTQTDLIKLLLVKGLAMLRVKDKKRRGVNIPVVKGDGLCDGVDLNSRAALNDLIDPPGRKL